MNIINERSHPIIAETIPHVIHEGLFGATLLINNEPIFFRAELLTEENAKCWIRYKNFTYWVANGDDNGVLSNLVEMEPPPYEEIKEVTGFTSEEYATFSKKVEELKKRNKKIVAILQKTTHCLHASFGAGRGKFVFYASKNRHFSIVDANKSCSTFNLKSYIDCFSDILISVGADFSKKKSFFLKGIFRNPYWVFDEKYAGLAFLLQGFSGAFAEQYFPEKSWLHVMPVGSMQTIIKSNLLKGDGYFERDGKKIDITEMEVSAKSPQGPLNHIRVSALARIWATTCCPIAK